MSNYIKLLQTLKQNQLGDLEIASFVSEISKGSMTKVFTQALSYITPEELKEIGEIEDEGEFNSVLETIYAEKVGASMEEAIDSYQEEVAAKMLKEIEKDPELLKKRFDPIVEEE